MAARVSNGSGRASARRSARFPLGIALLLAALVGVTGFGLWHIQADRAGALAKASPLSPATAPAGSPATRATTQPADNSYCFTCHLNFRDEELTGQHQRAGIGCTRCHGESDRHSSDENNITAPDVMYPREKINPSCLECHPLPDIAKANPNPHAARVCTSAAEGIRCTACHGRHVLAVRTRRWDKASGELIADDGVRMVDTPGPGRKDK